MVSYENLKLACSSKKKKLLNSILSLYYLCGKHKCKNCVCGEKKSEKGTHKLGFNKKLQ